MSKKPEPCGVVGAIITEEDSSDRLLCKGDDFGKFLPAFESVIKNTEIKADLKYGAQAVQS
jgi:hypothetical protein